MTKWILILFGFLMLAGVLLYYVHSMQRNIKKDLDDFYLSDKQANKKPKKE